MRPASKARIRIGISGWTYAPWRGVFYPKGLPQKQELHHASRRFRAIEINGTFYRLQRPEDFARWREETPDEFVFTVKAPRFITHILRLRDAQAPLANFLASGILRLGPKLGPILWQLPPSFKFDAERLESFLALLPHDVEHAAEIAGRHDERMNGRSWLTVESKGKFRHALEIRNDSFRTPEFIKLLRRHDVALVCADTVEWPRLMDVTADFMYCRLHGSEQLYVSGYDDRALDDWARRVSAWSEGVEPRDAERICPPGETRSAGRDVFVFFDNDAKVLAPANAAALAERLDAAPMGEKRRSTSAPKRPPR